MVEGLGLSPEERHGCRVLVLDARNRVIASSDGLGLAGETFPLRHEGNTRGYYVHEDRLVAYALTPGYETYRGWGWYGVVEWDMAGSGAAPARTNRAKAA